MRYDSGDVGVPLSANSLSCIEATFGEGKLRFNRPILRLKAYALRHAAHRTPRVLAICIADRIREPSGMMLQR